LEQITISFLVLKGNPCFYYLLAIIYPYSFIQLKLKYNLYLQDKSSPSLLTYGENKLKIPNMLKAELNCSGRSQPLRQRFEFLLDKLEPGTRYQVRLSARNHHGWGETSQPITFKTSQFIGEIIFHVIF
jgi:hypothetical protein